MPRKRANGRRDKSTGRVVAITGMTEFLGAGLASLLESDTRYRRVLALDVREPARLGHKAIYVHVDLTAPESGKELAALFRAKQVDSLVHLAFLARPGQDPVYAHELQVAGTMHLLHAASAAELTKVVMQGSTMSYGARPDNPSFLTEQKPLRGTPGSDFIADLIDAENQLMKFGQRHPECVTTILRFGNMLGPHVNTFMSRLLACHLSPRLMGYDPLVQFIHERDALRALKTALDEDHPGAFNIVADGVLHLSAVDRIAGQVALPIPHFLSQRLGNFLWTLQACPIPPRLLDYLRYPCVADGQRARNELGFEPRYSTRDTLLDFTRNLGVGSTPGKPGAGA